VYVIPNGINSREVSSTIKVKSPGSIVWQILTDYDNMPLHVPNLVRSKRLSPPSNDPLAPIRIFHEGGKQILGISFKAAITLNVLEFPPNSNGQATQKFSLVDSNIFDQFEGTWTVQTCPADIQSQTTLEDPCVIVGYSLIVRPKWFLPVVALEWLIREEVPQDLLAVKLAAEKSFRSVEERNKLINII
jgi:hypothetical protein